MKKLLFTILGIIIFSCYGYSQVIADFETSENGFVYGWGKCLSSSGVKRIADPTSMSAGVLQLSFDASGSDKEGAIGADISKLDQTNVKYITFYVYLASDTPDSLMLKAWAQDNAWTWVDYKFFAKDIPKGKWFPLQFNVDLAKAANNFDVTKPFQKTGLDIGTWNMPSSALTWKGNILVDNVLFVGVKPTNIATFETGNDNYGIGWGDLATSAVKVADPTSSTNGVLGVTLKISGSKDKNSGLGKDVSAIDITGQKVITQYFYLPADTPDSLLIKFWAQDNAWTWIDYKFYAVNLPKGKWFPLCFDLEGIKALNNSFILDKPLQKVGAQFDVNAFGLTNSTWTNTVYIDNVMYLNAKVETKWVVTDFNAAAGGNYGFTTQSWGPAAVALSNAVDPTNSGNRVLKEDVNFTSANNKAVIMKSGITLQTTKPDTVTAKYMTLDIWVPADMPKTGGQIGIFGTGSATTTWLETVYPIDDSVIVRGKWNTLKFDIANYISQGSLNPKLPLDMGIQIYYASNPTWASAIYYDNLTLWGVEAPKGDVVSPKVTVKVDTANFATSKFQYVELDWIDNTVGSEVYNVYYSTKPINSITDPGVIKIGDNIAHGIQNWAHRPWDISAANKTFYYAVTASADGITETPITAQCQAGPVTVKSSIPIKIQYVKDFAKGFSLDGLDNEWSAYKVNQVTPECAGGTRGPQWTPTSTDMNFKITFVADDKYLYFSGDCTDDDLRLDTTMQAWEGDAIEFYMGIYDAAKLSTLHPKNSTNAMGDWRIGFTDLGTVTLAGGAATTVPGCEAAVYQNLSGDGYIIEGRICLDSLASDHNLKVYNNLMLPIRIDLNDYDPKKGETSRGGIVQFGGWPGVNLDSDWLRPSTFGYAQIVGAPDAVNNTNTMPRQYKLYSNYPNPFNPATVIKYDLKENGKVSLKVYDILGRQVASLVDQNQKAGSYTVNFNASKLASGVYIYRLQAGSFEKSMKMLLLK